MHHIYPITWGEVGEGRPGRVGAGDEKSKSVSNEEKIYSFPSRKYNLQSPLIPILPRSVASRAHQAQGLELAIWCM